MKEEYQRIGTTLYKVVLRPSINGELIKIRQVWSYDVLRQDYGKEFIGTVPKYDGFCVVPNHVNYQLVINNHLNQYEPISHIPKEGECNTILNFLSHIFGEQISIGLDYIQLLYLQPEKKLPILLLVSKERNTGKTTFLNFLKAIFGGNMTFNTNEDFRSQFNADWTNKLIIAVDEVLLDRREDSERLKNLSTSRHHKTEAKGKDRIESQFFGKFILCSNNENMPLIIEPSETRYWVRKIVPFAKENTHLLEDLKKEIPCFLHFLSCRILTTVSESRMWFRFDLYKTEALQRIKDCNRNRLEIELKELILEIMETHNLEKFHFKLGDIMMLLTRLSIKAESNQIRRILQFDWKLEPCSNSLTYITYEYNYNTESNYSVVKRVGRFYTVTKEQLLSF